MNRTTAPSQQPKRQDRTLFCRRCGVSFLWIAEEQSEGGAPAAGEANPSSARVVRPSLCPACRRLEPPSGRERGLVKWYNRRKRFGFITRKGQPDIFVHGSSVQGRGALAPDQLVEFSIDENDQGLIATEVVRLNPAALPSAAATIDPGSEAATQSGAAPEAPGEHDAAADPNADSPDEA